jgi:Chemotaxis phosphatase CheX
VVETIDIEDLAQSLARQVRAYLAEEMGTPVSGWRKPAIPEGPLTLDSLTVTVGIGDSSGLTVALSFSSQLAEHLFRRTLAQMNLSLSSMPPMEQEIYRQGTLLEAVNVIAGHWLPDYPSKDQKAVMTPPALLDRAKQIRGVARAQLAAIDVGTEHGELRIWLIKPRSLVEQELKAA